MQRKERQAQNFKRKIKSFLAYFLHNLKSSAKSLLITFLIFLILALIIIPFVKKESNPLQGENFSFSLIDEDQSFVGPLLEENLLELSYVKQVYNDDLEKAQKRLEEGETVMAVRLPEHLFDDARVGKVENAIDFWVSPHMQDDVAKFSSMIKQYAISANLIYSRSFAFQRIYYQLTGDEEASWKITSRHAADSIIKIIQSGSYIYYDSERSFDSLAHVAAGLMLLLALVPTILVLQNADRLAGSDLEDRLILHCGFSTLIVADILQGLVWFLALLLPFIIILRRMFFIVKIWPLFLVLLSAYLSAALIMQILGRANLLSSNKIYLAWIIIFTLLLTAGAHYPEMLFPSSLRRVLVCSPYHYNMQIAYNTLRGLEHNKVHLLLSFWPLAAASIFAFWKLRRRA